MDMKYGDKGQKAEETLRAYFSSIGYFAVRGVPFTYSGFDITDIDLWLYIKTSSITRERINVDIKRKKTPQAIERVFWTKGVQQILGFDKCIVATTDNRKATKNFGALNDVIVLDGEFIQRVLKHFDIVQRISEEELLQCLDKSSIIDSRINWRKFYRNSKKILLNGLSYNGINILLGNIKLIVEEMIVADKKDTAHMRLLYILIAYILITVDYISRLLFHHDIALRKVELTEGFNYGEAGRERADEILNRALQLVENTPGANLFFRSQMEAEIKQQLASYPAEILAEYFSKTETLKNLFSLAKQFEAMAFIDNIVEPNSLEPPMKALIGLLCDFYQIDRKKVI